MEGHEMNVYRWTQGAAAALLLTACSSTEWAHPKKPKEAFALDYRECQETLTNDPKYQQGSKLLLENGIERCVRGKGWLLVEKP
jgi:outer membrane biogenesis lipoprotein LolB